MANDGSAQFRTKLESWKLVKWASKLGTGRSEDGTVCFKERSLAMADEHHGWELGNGRSEEMKLFWLWRMMILHATWLNFPEDP